MAIAPYDPSTGGPSQAAQMSQLGYQDTLTDAANRSDLATSQGRNRQQFLGLGNNGQSTGFGTAAQLQSSLGANGQLYGSAGRYQEGQAQTQFQNQQADLTTAFNRAHMDLKRQEAFAAIGLIL